MSDVNRRGFLGGSLGALAGVCTVARDLSSLAAATGATEHKLRYLGWQVGLSYQTPRPEGKRREELRQLIREMRDHGMNFLSLMLISYSYFDDHDGFCWPPRRKSLQCYRDELSLNADERTEFLGDVIREACEARLHVQLMTNWGLWNPDRIRRGYPGAAVQETASGRRAGWLHCPDNPDVFRCGRDEILDAIERYAALGVKSYAIEYPGYGGADACFCRFTRDAFARETGQELAPPWAKANAAVFELWKQEHIGRLLKQLVGEVRASAPGLEMWLHTACAHGRGHSPSCIQDAGIRTVMPYMLHTAGDFSDVPGNLQAVHPLPAVGHVCVRSKPFKNYPVPPKTPDVIGRFFEAIGRARASNLVGLAFFNESCVSDENRKAVYAGIRRFQ